MRSLCRFVAIVLPISLATLASPALASDAIPIEPVEIGNIPQFVFDNYIVDNHWAIKYKREAVTRVFHQATKHAANPILKGDQPSFLWVVHDDDAGVFRMYYQANFRMGGDPKAKGRKFRTHIAYAESKDGVHWKKPDLNLFAWHKSEPNNLVIGRADVPAMESCGPCILDVPKKDRRGHRFLMLYRAKGRGIRELSGIRIAGSNDGIHWDETSDKRIAHLHSDHHNTISFDGRLNQYVMFCRAKHIYRAGGETMLDTGASRRVARMTSKSLWSGWLEHNKPQTILTPDEIDSQKHFNFFYGMPTRHWAGIYWGFLEPFRMNDFIYTELALSRDGIHFIRPHAGDAEHPTAKPAHRKIIPRLVINTQQSFLSQVFRELSIARVAKKESNQRTLMIVDQLVKAGRITALDADHALIVFGHCVLS